MCPFNSADAILQIFAGANAFRALTRGVGFGAVFFLHFLFLFNLLKVDIVALKWKCADIAVSRIFAMSRSHGSPVLQPRFGILPDDAVVLNDNLAFQRFEGKITFYNSGGPFFRCNEDDKSAVRLAQEMLVSLKLASVAEIARVFEVDRSTATRNHKRYNDSGPDAIDTKRGPRRA